MEKSATQLLPLLLTTLSCGAALWGTHWFLIGRHPSLGNERKFSRQIIMLGLTALSLIIIVLSLPISETFRNQLLGLIGLLVSGIMAFSSTTILSNLMGGLLLRTTKPFRIGDFVRAGEHFGRVSERGLFDTEIQTETGDLIALPNTYLINNPITTTRSSGTTISTTLSLGFDIHHSKVETLLLKAAEESGLTEPFVHIMELGDFSVTYRISGFLTEVKQLITARSNLCRQVLDVLHSAGVEIMSPNFVNQRRMENKQKIIPAVVGKTSSPESSESLEDIVFDKAERAEQFHNEKELCTEKLQELEASLKEASEEDKVKIKEHIEKNQEILKAIELSEDELNKTP